MKRYEACVSYDATALPYSPGANCRPSYALEIRARDPRRPERPSDKYQSPATTINDYLTRFRSIIVVRIASIIPIAEFPAVITLCAMHLRYPRLACSTADDRVLILNRVQPSVKVC